MDEEARRLRRIGSIKEICFRRRRNEPILPSDLTLAGSEFHTFRIGVEINILHKDIHNQVKMHTA